MRYDFIIENRSRLIRILSRKYGCCCAYCKMPFLGFKSVQIDSYIPRRNDEEIDINEKNLILACRMCSVYKGATNPISDEGEILILHPYKEKYADHMSLEENGKLVGTTKEGESTINLLNLNRDELKEYRKNNSDDFMILFSDPSYDPIKYYNDSINNLKSLLILEVKGKVIEEYFNKILYGNVIAVLEAYLFGTIFNLVRCNDKLKWNCVEHFDWNKEKVDINDIKKVYDSIDSKLINALQKVLYHNLGVVRAIYNKCFNIDILSEKEEMDYLYKAINQRHAIVHRNGTKVFLSREGKYETVDIKISSSNIYDLISHTDKLVHEIETQISEKKYKTSPPNNRY